MTGFNELYVRVSISIDGVLSVKIINPRRASYGVENLTYKLAHTTEHSELESHAIDMET